MSPLIPPSSFGSAAARSDGVFTGVGYKSWSADPSSYNNAVAPNAGTLEATAIGLNAGDNVTNLVFVITVGGSGAAPTLIRVGIWDNTFALVASSVDSHASAIWTATGIAVAPLSAVYAVPASGTYWVGWLKVGTFATTQPTFLSGTTQTLAGRAGTGIARRWFEQTGLADLPAPAVPANPTNAPIWIGAS